MSEYFKTVKTKSAAKSERTLEVEEGNHKDLLQYYKKQTLYGIDKEELCQTYGEWFLSLIRGLNVMVYGQQSKMQILDTFHIKYMTPERVRSVIPEANLEVIRLHGFTPVSMERFLHAVMGINSRLTDAHIDQFFKDIQSQSKHCLFVMHSMDLLMRDCRKVCELIFELLVRNRDLIHILASSDHINSGKIFNPLRLKLNLMFYWIPGTTSFLSERLDALNMTAFDWSKDAAVADQILSSQLSLRSYTDVYQALGPKHKWIMLQVLKNHLLHVELAKNEKTQIQLPFDDLLKQCQEEFVNFRASALRSLLAELKDHRMISLDVSGNKMRCLIEPSMCKELLKLEREDE